jgi:hypothetical protein
MFRAAFPTAPEADEKQDAAWVKNAYDTSGANGGYSGTGKRQLLRLAGTWLPPSVALALAEEYHLTSLVKPLVEADPDMDQQFKKSTRSGANAVKEEEMDEGTPQNAPVPTSKSRSSPPAPKRRKASPSAAATPLSPPQTGRKLRSSRSPAPAPVTASPKSAKPASRRGRKVAAEPEVEPVPEVAGVDPESDIEESKKLVAAIKAAYNKPSSGATDVASEKATTRNKRTQEDEKITFEPKEPEIGERAIAGPRRLRALPPQRQAVAWGALALAVGFGLRCDGL